MSFEIESPQGQDSLTEFVLFFDRANESRSARWPAPIELNLPFLLGESPFCEGRKIRPFVARRDGEIVARTVAVIDARYNRHWNDKLGHIAWFEALPDNLPPVRRCCIASGRGGPSSGVAAGSRRGLDR